VTCFVLIRNLLAKGDSRIKEVIKKSKNDKYKTFDKIILLMLENCEKIIKQEHIDTILTPENILTNDENYMSFLNFSDNLFMDPFYEIVFSEEEKEILKDISNVYQPESEEAQVAIDIENLPNLEKMKFIGVGAGSMLILYLIICFFNYICCRKKIEKVEKFENRKRK
jgi:hypothetical protein